MIVLLSEDTDLLKYQPNLDMFYPRIDKNGNNQWAGFHQIAAEEIDRLLRSRKDTFDRFDMSLLSDRSREQLRLVAACFALHFLFEAANVQANNAFMMNRSKYFLDRAYELFNQESQLLDYDENNDGTIQDWEEDRPMGIRFLRG